MNDLISIVVPVYNVDKFLERCVNSLLFQSYQPIEIILINDGSTDNSQNICDRFKKENENVFVFHQSNRGLSAARNLGIQNAKGKYITFVDSDDFVNNKFIEILKGGIDINFSDISICNFKRVYKFEDDNILNISGNKIIYSPVNKEFCINKLLDEQSFTSAWGKMYLTSLFNNIKFPVGKYYEDLFIMPLLFFNATKITINNSELYYYNQIGTSITRSKSSIDKLSNLLEAFQKRHEFIIKNFPDFKKKSEAVLLSSCILNYSELLFINDPIAKIKLKNIYDFINENFSYHIRNINVKRNDKIKLLLLKVGFLNYYLKTHNILKKLQ